MSYFEPKLLKIESKLARNESLNEEDGLLLFDAPLSFLAYWAHKKKQERFGSTVTYIKNYYLNLTNVCRYACKYCGFRRNPGDQDSYVLTLDEIEAKLFKAPEAIREVWLSSGLNAALPFSFYTDVIKRIKKVLPKVHLKAFTAVEIDFFAKHFGYTHEYVLDTFIEAGLDRIPGGGAEILDPAIRKKIDIKTSPEDYLKIHGLCHKRDLPTSMTMLFGHVEERIHRIRHMIRIREFQSSSLGVQAFIPLAYQDENNPLAKRGVRGPGPVETLKTLAISRLMMDNIDHIQSFWVDSGSETTQISLHFGVDDVNGTLIEENIAHKSGSKTKCYESAENLERWIRSAGFVPEERDMRFHKVSSD